MYEAHWHLTNRPFENCVDQKSYYPSEVHQGALLKLRYAIENHRGAALLAGGCGSGKTLVVNALRRLLPECFSPFVHLVFPQMSSREILAYLADELTDAHAPTGHTIDESVRRLQQFFAANSGRARHAVVVIDEAQVLAESGGLETLRLLLNFESAAKPALTLLLVGQPTIVPALERLPALEQRLGVKCLLRPLTLEETVSYVTHRLTAAGATREIFTSDALSTLHQLTSGNPRRINRLCDLALLIGYAEEQSVIGPLQVESVSHELLTVSPE